MLKFLKKLFTPKKREKTFREKVFDEIKKCDDFIFQYTRDIYLMKKKLRTLIHSIFEVPEKYWYEELEHFEDILEHNENSDISAAELLQIEGTVRSVRIQIEIRKKKIDFYKKSIREFKEMLEEYERKRKEMQALEKRREAIKKLTEMQALESASPDDIKTSLKLEELKQDLKKIDRKLEIKKEIIKQLAELYYKYGSAQTLPEAENYKNKALKEIKNNLH